jgi:hypothetical protein
MTSEFDAFRAVNFDWTRQLKSVWRDPHYHVPGLHRQAVDDVRDYFFLKTVDPDPDDEPLGRVIVGPKGFGNPSHRRAAATSMGKGGLVCPPRLYRHQGFLVFGCARVSQFASSPHGGWQNAMRSARPSRRYAPRNR